MYWTMRNGKQIKISDMTTEHIINCLRMLERGTFDQDKIEKYDSLLKELRSRGEDWLPIYIEDSEVSQFDSWEED